MGDILNDIRDDVKKDLGVDGKPLYKLTAIVLGIIAKRSSKGLPFRVSVLNKCIMFVAPGNRLGAYKKVRHSNRKRIEYAKAIKGK